MKTEIKVDLNYLQDGAVRKYRQMVCEIERGDSLENIKHSAYKLGEFLRTSLGDAWRMPVENTETNQ